MDIRQISSGVFALFRQPTMRGGFVPSPLAAPNTHEERFALEAPGYSPDEPPAAQLMPMASLMMQAASSAYRTPPAMRRGVVHSDPLGLGPGLAARGALPSGAGFGEP